MRSNAAADLADTVEAAEEVADVVEAAAEVVSRMEDLAVGEPPAVSSLTLSSLPPAAERTSRMDTSRSTCSTTRSEYGRRDASRRVAGDLNVDQEEVLIALMFDEFMATDMKSLDYDRVVRNAVTIQSDPDVCGVLNMSPIPIEQAWIPPDDCAPDGTTEHARRVASPLASLPPPSELGPSANVCPLCAGITDMCFAFASTESQLTSRSYPSNDITPPAMTMLVERASEKRTGIKNRRPIRPKMPTSAPLQPGVQSPSAMPAAAGDASWSSSPGGVGTASSRSGAGVGSSRPASASPGGGKAKAKKSSKHGSPSAKSTAASAASLLADPRPKPTGSKSKAK